jgi:LysM repeat protein
LPSPTPFKYRVQAGDTLGAIAIKYGTSVQAIMDANNLSSNLLHIGDELIIPLPTPTPR